MSNNRFTSPLNFLLSWRCLRGRLFSRNKRSDCFIDGPVSSPSDYDSQTHGDDEQMILKSFARLLTEPVHKEPIPPMDDGDGTDHVAENAERSDSS